MNISQNEQQNEVQGYRGLQGYMGVQGSTGTQGYTGIQGYTGVQGATGIQGVVGTMRTAQEDTEIVEEIQFPKISLKEKLIARFKYKKLKFMKNKYRFITCQN